MQLSPHFSLAELTFTQVRGVDNTPSLGEVDNLKYLCKQLLEPLRAEFGPLIITSGYRNAVVNLAVGGSPTSAHLKGNAADVIPRRSDVRWGDIIEWVATREDLPLDQIIFEAPGGHQPWLHIGTRACGVGVRHQALMCFELGLFEPWNSRDARVTR